MTTDSIDSGEEDTVGIIFENVTAGASFDDLLNEVIGLVHSENEDFRGGSGSVDATGGLDAVEERHTDIEDGYVRLKLGGFFDGVSAVGGFGADLPMGMGFEEGAKASADDRVVVSDEDA